jgi:hypothetical protein
MSQCDGSMSHVFHLRLHGMFDGSADCVGMWILCVDGPMSDWIERIAIHWLVSNQRVDLAKCGILSRFTRHMCVLFRLQ